VQSSKRGGQNIVRSKEETGHILFQRRQGVGKYCGSGELKKPHPRAIKFCALNYREKKKEVGFLGKTRPNLQGSKEEKENIMKESLNEVKKEVMARAGKRTKLKRIEKMSRNKG